MGVFDNMKDMAQDLKAKAEDLVDQHGEQAGEGLDKVGEFANEKTGGTHTAQIDGGVARAKDGLDGLDGKDDDIA
ncbi:MAG: antitoxin [Lapillicoccus sp.]